MFNWFKKFSTGEKVLFCLLFITAIIAISMNPESALALPLFFGAVKVRDGMSSVRTMGYTHTAATTKDIVYLLGGRPMLAVNTALANAKNVFVYEGVIEYAKNSAEAWTVGVTVYWDNTNSVFTTVSTANTKAGIAVEAAANPSATGFLLLMPSVTA